MGSTNGHRAWAEVVEATQEWAAGFEEGRGQTGGGVRSHGGSGATIPVSLVKAETFPDILLL